MITILTLSLSAQNNLTFEKIDRDINQHLFNGDWQTSDSIITVKLGEQPNSLKYNFLKAYNYFYTRYVGNNNTFTRDQTIRQVKKYAWDAIKLGEELEANLENNFYLGSSYAYLSRVNIMNQEYWEGYWNASKAENYFEDVIDENPNVADAYLNLGVNEYFPAIAVTGFQSVLAWFGGMSGDREKGINYFEKVSDKGDLYKDEANYILALLHSFRENNLSVGHEYWKMLSEKFPTNNIFELQMNRSYISKLVDEKGVDFLNNEFNDLDSLYNINNPGILNILGYNLINQNRLEEALIVFKVNVKKYPEVANGYDSLAECYMTMGDNENAIKYYKIAFEKLETDTTITDDFRQRLEEGIRNNLEELSSRIDV
jgi:tetratricopeptide (TPR) repeat protein